MGLRAREGSFVVNSNALLEEAERESCVASWCFKNCLSLHQELSWNNVTLLHSLEAETTGVDSLTQLAFGNPYYVLGTMYKTEKINHKNIPKVSGVGSRY